MTTRALIAKLKTLDQDAEVLVAVHTSTKAYSVAEVPVSENLIDCTFNGATISIFLPGDMYVSHRKVAA